MEPAIRPLVPADADAYAALRREMLLDAPLAFLASPDDDRARDPDAVRDLLSQGPAHVVLGAWAGGDLVGAVGIFRERPLKAAHRAQVWGMYVTPGWRRHGVGRALMEAALAHARALSGVTQVGLAVSDATPEARRLYEAVGFRVWGTQPTAMAHEGQHVDEHHMALDLDGPAAPPALHETVRTGVVRVALPPDQALPLFTAVGETKWVPGWSPTFVSPPDGATVPGGVWLTRDGETEVIWRVQRYDPRARVAEYLRVVPGDRVVVVRVACAPGGSGTLATVSYAVTPISPTGKAWLAAFTDEAFAAMLAEWERLLAAHLGSAP